MKGAAILFMGALLLCSTTVVGAEKSKIKGEKAKMTNNPVVVMETNQGTIEIQLYPDVAPKACENFIKLAQKGYYNGIIFHRVIKRFMIQGGDPTGTGRGGESIWGKPFEDEFTEKLTFNKPGILAMANAGPNTNGSQFFITTAETQWLNMHHTIFGEVVKGYEVVQKIENTKTGPGDKPLEDQKIIKITIKNVPRKGK
jgi:peptidylprolyl isomerase